MTIEKPSVLIYNPISCHGHLDSWNATFIALLLEDGWPVMALTPDVPALMSRLSVKGLTQSSRLRVLPWKDVRTPLLVRLKEQICSRHRRGPEEEATEFDPEKYLFVPAAFAARIKAAVKRTSQQPAFVFNMYMDAFKTDRESWDQFSKLNPLPWAGIRFVPRDLPVEGYYRIASLKGMCLLDEEKCRIYRDHLADKVVEYLPDATEVTLPERPSTLAREITRRARGRKIVFLGGSIGGQKNLSYWYEVIERADPRRWFFAQVGEVYKPTLTPEDVVALERVTANPPENLILIMEYLPDDRVFNEIIALSDVLFAVYRDFKISSNMLCKAATFKKPLLASDRYLMGERVRHYGIGLTVTEDDGGAILDGLSRIADSPIPDENFSRFCQDFSQETLAKRLTGFLTKCL